MPEAHEDLRAIRQWIARDSPRFADLTTRRIQTAVGQLARFPQSRRIPPERSGGKHRELIVGSYRVLYLYDAENDTVAVVAVIQGSRTLPPVLPGG